MDRSILPRPPLMVTKRYSVSINGAPHAAAPSRAQRLQQQLLAAPPPPHSKGVRLSPPIALTGDCSSFLPSFSLFLLRPGAELMTPGQKLLIRGNILRVDDRAEPFTVEMSMEARLGRSPLSPMPLADRFRCYVPRLSVGACVVLLKHVRVQKAHGYHLSDLEMVAALLFFRADVAFCCSLNGIGPLLPSGG